MFAMKPQYSTKLFDEIYSTVTKFTNDYGQLGFPKTISDSNCEILYYLLFSRYGNSPIANMDENQFKVKLQGIIWQFGPTWEKRLDIQDKLRKLTENQMLSGAGRKLDINNKETNTSSGTSSNTRTLNTTDTQTGGDYTNTLSGGNTKSTSNGAVITNHATNPGEISSTKTTTDPTMLTYIDSQTAQVDKDRVTTNERTSNEVTTHARVNDDEATHTGTIGDSGNDSRTSTNNGTSIHTESSTKGLLNAYAELWELLDNDVTNDFVNRFKTLFKAFVRPENTFLYITEEDVYE